MHAILKPNQLLELSLDKDEHAETKEVVRHVRSKILINSVLADFNSPAASVSIPNEIE